MGILSKLRERKRVFNKPEVLEERVEKKKSEKPKARKKKSSEKFDIPEISDVNSWLKEVAKMAKDGVDGIDDYYDKIASVDDVGSLVMNLGMVVSNYLSFRYELYNKLSEHIGDTDKAIKMIDSKFKDLDREFFEKVVEVLSRWSRR